MSALNSQPFLPTPIAVAPSQAVHLFEIANYSQHRGLVAGSFLRSKTFDVGGCAWSIRFFPNGDTSMAANDGYVSAALELMTKEAMVAVSYDLSLTDQAAGARYFALQGSNVVCDNHGVGRFFPPIYHCSRVMRKSDLEASTFLRDDRLVIECTLRVLYGTRTPEAASRLPEADDVPPPSDLPDHLGRLLKEGTGADVTFHVQGKTFPAHRMLLAARSPVFKAELLGPMKEGSACSVAVHEIRPEVFEALLYFAYTDSLPPMGVVVDDDDSSVQMVGDLLIAADGYAMDRLKLVCEQTLSRSLTVDNVSALLVLANGYNCRRLKDACTGFMMSDRLDDVTRTQGYACLKTDHPGVLIELFEDAIKLR